MIRTRRSCYLPCILESDTEEEEEEEEDNKDLKILVEPGFCLYISQNDKIDYFKNTVMNCRFWMVRIKQPAVHFLFSSLLPRQMLITKSLARLCVKKNQLKTLQKH